ncbi:hypothetical protein ACA910_006757 [Epithemia clementina (nom. ined.)]
MIINDTNKRRTTLWWLRECRRIWQLPQPEQHPRAEEEEDGRMHNHHGGWHQEQTVSAIHQGGSGQPQQPPPLRISVSRSSPTCILEEMCLAVLSETTKLTQSTVSVSTLPDGWQQQQHQPRETYSSRSLRDTRGASACSASCTTATTFGVSSSSSFRRVPQEQKEDAREGEPAIQIPNSRYQHREQPPHQTEKIHDREWQMMNNKESRKKRHNSKYTNDNQKKRVVRIQSLSNTWKETPYFSPSLPEPEDDQDNDDCHGSSIIPRHDNIAPKASSRPNNDHPSPSSPSCHYDYISCNTTKSQSSSSFSVSSSDTTFPQDLEEDEEEDEGGEERAGKVKNELKPEMAEHSSCQSPLLPETRDEEQLHHEYKESPPSMMLVVRRQEPDTLPPAKTTSVAASSTKGRSAPSPCCLPPLSREKEPIWPGKMTKRNSSQSVFVNEQQTTIHDPQDTTNTPRYEVATRLTEKEIANASEPARTVVGIHPSLDQMKSEMHEESDPVSSNDHISLRLSFDIMDYDDNMYCIGAIRAPKNSNSGDGNETVLVKTLDKYLIGWLQKKGKPLLNRIFSFHDDADEEEKLGKEEDGEQEEEHEPSNILAQILLGESCHDVDSQVQTESTIKIDEQNMSSSSNNGDACDARSAGHASKGGGSPPIWMMVDGPSWLQPFQI